jgi:hypothetical protein
MTDNLTDQDFLDMNDLCDDSLDALIQHYLSVKQRMPDSLTVRERLVGLQDEQLKRSSASTIEGVIRQTTDNPLQNQS